MSDTMEAAIGNPFVYDGIPEPSEEIQQALSRVCICEKLACQTAQEGAIKDQEMWVSIGRTSPAKAAQKVLQKVGCPKWASSLPTD